MFTKEKSTAPDVQQTLKVVQLDFKPSKAEQQLREWTDKGWKLQSTEAVLIMGQTAFILAFLVHDPA